MIPILLNFKNIFHQIYISLHINLEPFSLHFALILTPFWVHFGSISAPGGIPETWKSRILEGLQNVVKMLRFWEAPMSPFSIKKHQKIYGKFCWNFICILDRFWEPIELQKPTQNHQKINEKILRKFIEDLLTFLNDFSSILSPRTPPKNTPKKHKTASNKTIQKIHPFLQRFPINFAITV